MQIVLSEPIPDTWTMVVVYCSGDHPSAELFRVTVVALDCATVVVFMDHLCVEFIIKIVVLVLSEISPYLHVLIHISDQRSVENTPTPCLLKPNMDGLWIPRRRSAERNRSCRRIGLCVFEISHISLFDSIPV